MKSKPPFEKQDSETPGRGKSSFASGSGYPVPVLMIGLGGYGIHYATEMLEMVKKGMARIAAVVDPYVEKAEAWPEFQRMGVLRFDTLDEYLAAATAPAALATIASPISWHMPQATACLQAGMNVLCEKPVCATIQDARKMIEARDASGRFLEIGYQWSFGTATGRLKADILRGDLGAPVQARCWVPWPRRRSYYQRNRWAGRIRDERGAWVLDSPVNNATAHYLHHMLYLLGPSPERAALPVALQGECYRAKPIENFDTACCRVPLDAGGEILFFSSHSPEKPGAPEFFMQFENATLDYPGTGSMRALFRDGTVREYGDPAAEGVMHKLRVCLENTVRENPERICGPEAARMHTLCVNALQETETHAVDPEFLKRETFPDGDAYTQIRGLYDAMRRGFRTGALFSELKNPPPWARKAQDVPLRDYAEFPSGGKSA